MANIWYRKVQTIFVQVALHLSKAPNIPAKFEVFLYQRNHQDGQDVCYKRCGYNSHAQLMPCT